MSARRPARAAAVPQTRDNAFTAPDFIDPATAQSWHFLIANADFMLNDENSEHFPEVLRERRRFFLENQAAINFFIVPNPAWLDALPEVAKRVRQPAVALVSPDASWIMCAPCAAAARWQCRGGRRAVQPCRGRGAGARRGGGGAAAAPRGPEPRPTCADSPAPGAPRRPRRYMKLRMDRVLKGELSGSMADVTASKGPAPTFPKPAAWTAPYSKYSAGAYRMRAVICWLCTRRRALTTRVLRHRLVVDVRGEAVSGAPGEGSQRSTAPARAQLRHERRADPLCVSIQFSPPPWRHSKHKRRTSAAALCLARLGGRFSKRMHGDRQQLRRGHSGFHTQEDWFTYAKTTPSAGVCVRSRLVAREQDARVVAAEAERVGQRHVNLRATARG